MRYTKKFTAKLWFNLETQNQRADFVVIGRKKNEGFIFDPTIRWETNMEVQDEDVNVEKRAIYVPCKSDLIQRYCWEMKGLWFGARESASPFLVNFFKNHSTYS